MRIAVISDIHANLEALDAVLQSISVHGVDHIICLGDIVGYNANPNECIASLRKLSVLSVGGNHDRAVAGKITTEGFSKTAARAVVWTRSRLNASELEYLATRPLQLNVGNCLVAVHGALHPLEGKETVRLNTDERRMLSFSALVAEPSGAHICAFGHTHELGVYELRGKAMRKHEQDEVFIHADSYYLINPGSVGQPRSDERRATYIVIDFFLRVIQVHRIGYDAALTLAKTRSAGLSPMSSYLPEFVRRPIRAGLRAIRPLHE